MEITILYNLHFSLFLVTLSLKMLVHLLSNFKPTYIFLCKVSQVEKHSRSSMHQTLTIFFLLGSAEIWSNLLFYAELYCKYVILYHML